MRIFLFSLLTLSFLITTIFAQNQYEPIPYVKIKHPEWARKAVMYQINTRAFTKEGTFRAAEKHLPRLKELGVDILWIMPINPIGEKIAKARLAVHIRLKIITALIPNSAQ